LVELKVGPIRDEHIGQILSYEGMLLSTEDPTIKVILIGNRVPPNIQKNLDHHGIAWREIPVSHLKETLLRKNDKELLKLIEDERGFDLGNSILGSKITITQPESAGIPKTKGDMEKLFGSRIRAKIIGWFFTHVDEAFFVRQISYILKEDPTNISREMSNLEKLEILISNRHGNLKHFQVKHDCRFFEELKGLVLKLTR